MLTGRLRAFVTGCVFALLVAGCGRPEPETIMARPAFWQVDGPNGERGYLLGTIHRLPAHVEWRGKVIDAALGDAGMLVLETADVGEPAKMQAIFERLAYSPGRPLLKDRVLAADRPHLSTLMEKAGYKTGDFRSIETWAAALILAQALQDDSDGGVANGVDAQLMALAGARPVKELEGSAAQLAVFDTLAEQDQRDLLGAIVREADNSREKADLLDKAWMTGDMAAIAREADTGMMADTELRDALLMRRNARWANMVDAWLRAGERPFLAAGAAHMAGAEGLPALLELRGWTVKRVQ
ncbi:MAG: TraB/GumN family protein [Novosphingobium sp.]|nr:TraB/GumN family protein [Novosphingobium sp.]